jgi:hypothetical protein
MIAFENTRNPVLPLGIHIPDSEPHVMPDGRVYVYGSFDNREDVFCSEEYHVVSTPDMKSWTIYDKSLDGNDIEWSNNTDYPHYPGIDWSHPTPFILKMLELHPEDKEAFEKEDDGPKPNLLFAPDCIERDGKYYLYFCMNDDSEGVAVSDRPEGPFTDWKLLPIGGIDPAVFIDDDGQAYLYWGQLFSHGAKLYDNMVTLDEGSITDDLVTEVDHYFHEGSSMRKIGDTYYYIYACIAYGKPTSIGYSTGKSPMGPFEYKGVIINNEFCDPASWNNHGSIVKFGDQWYVFYHRCSRGVQQHRRLCIEKIEILPDGTIPEVRMTSQGAGDPFAPGEAIMGYQACEVHGGCYIDLDDEYEEALTHLDAGCKAVFRYVKSDADRQSVRLIASGHGELAVLLNGAKAGSLSVDCDEYTEISAAISAPAGEAELVIEVTAGKGIRIAEITLY